MWPKCAFGDQRGPIQMAYLVISPDHGRTAADFLFFIYIFVWGKKWRFGSKSDAAGVLWTEREVADLKQRQEVIRMDHKNKIQSLVLPTDDPAEAQTACEDGPCTC